MKNYDDKINGEIVFVDSKILFQFILKEIHRKIPYDDHFYELFIKKYLQIILIQTKHGIKQIGWL